MDTWRILEVFVVGILSFNISFAIYIMLFKKQKWGFFSDINLLGSPPKNDFWEFLGFDYI